MMNDDFKYRRDEAKRKYLMEINGRMTFAGAFLNYFYQRPRKKDEGFQEDGEYEIQDSEPYSSVFSRSISDATMERYIDEIIDRVIPEIDPYGMTMEDYDLAYFEEALIRIKRKYVLTDDSSYRLNIRRIYNAWANRQRSLINRIIWPEDETRVNTKESVEKRKRRLSKPRSLGIPGEIEIFRWFLSLDDNSIGKADIGIILMFFLGLRNAEAAGRTFGDIRKIQGTSHHCIYVMTTTVGATRELKIGGKTRNAFRVIPLYDFLYDFLMRRREYLLSEWKKKDPGLTEDELDRKISMQRIASDASDNEGVSSPDLTRRGKDILTNILGKCRKADVSYQDAEYDFRYKLQSMGLEGEDSPTTYLFRRNYATHAVNIGLSASQVEFLIGHEIEEQGVLRHFFSSGEELAYMAEILQEHPFCLLDRILRGTEDEKREYLTRSIEMDNISNKRAMYVRILANEPSDDIDIEFPNGGIKATGSKRRLELPHGYSEEMNIRRKILDVYKKRTMEYINADRKSQGNGNMQ